jgi:hypothetical protein
MIIITFKLTVLVLIEIGLCLAWWQVHKRG